MRLRSSLEIDGIDYHREVYNLDARSCYKRSDDWRPKGLTSPDNDRVAMPRLKPELIHVTQVVALR
jgi:hypothetical protein